MRVREIIASIHQNPRAGWPVRIGLFPVYLASLAYGAVMRARRWCYRAGVLPIRRLPAVVVCVGNITTGGTGKTPAVVHLARRLNENGIKTAVISRGYGFQVAGEYLIVAGPDGARLKGGEAPDEALMTARKLPGVPVIVSPDRYRAGRAAVDLFGAEVVLMDDGFQHLGLFRDIDVLALDGANPTGNGLVLPAGPLREPVSGARRADAVWITGQGKARLPARLGALLGGKPVIRARTVPVGLATAIGEAEAPQSLSGTRVFVFCGIARPERFFKAVGRTGAAAAGYAAFPDHYRYTTHDVERLNRRARDAGAELMLTTEKDLARLPADAPFALPVTALSVDLEVAGDDALIELIGARLKEKTR